MRKTIILALFFLLIIPLSSLNAETYISEIMYDPEGTDSKREWIEVYSDDYSDLSNIKFKENDVSHSIKIYKEGVFNKYFVVADNPEAFLVDFPDFEGYLYDSAFSLSNSGETLLLSDNGVVLDEITYTPELGAKSNGNSLQKNGEIFIEAIPTPAKENEDKEYIPEDDNSSNDDSQNENKEDVSSHSSAVELTYFVPDELEIGAGRERVVTINTPVFFKAEKNTKDRVKFHWVLGDGRRKKGEEIYYEYKYPGKYNVVLHGKAKDQYSVSRTTIKVISPEIETFTEGGNLFVRNNSDKEVNLGRFNVVRENQDFTFPEDTILSANSEIILDEELLGFDPSYSYLEFPNGKKVNDSMENLVKQVENIKDMLSRIEKSNVL